MLGIKRFIRKRIIVLVLNELKKELEGSKMFQWLSGKKSYIVAVAGVIINGLAAMGYVGQETVVSIDMVLASLFGITIRQAIKKAEK